MSLAAAHSHAGLCAHTPFVHRHRLEMLRDMLHESVEFAATGETATLLARVATLTAERDALLTAYDRERAAHGETARRLERAEAGLADARRRCPALHTEPGDRLEPAAP